jgi:(+)-trans-carveol dehydrogenase
MGRFSGRTVFISGAGRGQGRSHAVRFAQEGANVIMFDRCQNLPEVQYPLATPADLDETARLVREQGVGAYKAVADVRDMAAVEQVLVDGSAELGRPSVIIANAGITTTAARSWEITEQAFRTVVDVDLVGVWHTLAAGVRLLRAHDEPGSCVATGSGASIKGLANIGAYVAAKHGVLGLVRTMARELGPFGIRVNAVLPGNAHTDMFDNDAMRRLFIPDTEDRTERLFRERASAGSPMGLPWVEPADISEAVLFLASDAARYVTGIALPVDGGTAIP